MKTRFNTYDIICGVAELQKLVGQRVNQIYDVDNKTYLIRFQGGAEKCTLLIESGTRFHTTGFEWPKNVAPSGFSMKLRKHLKNKRLESLRQLGADRIIDMQFGVGEASYHIILELYDRGNIILTDHELTILYILRPHTEGEELRFAIREKYPEDRAKQRAQLPSKEELVNRINTTEADSLYYFIMSLVDCGPAVVEHVLTKHNLNNCLFEVKQTEENANEAGNVKRKQRKSKKQANNSRIFNMQTDMDALHAAIEEADEMVTAAAKAPSKGFIIRKREEKVSMHGSAEIEHFYQNLEYHPYLFKQFENQPIADFDTFMLAVDEFYSTLEGQRIDMKTLQQERDVLKKLTNVKQDHAKRLEDLNKAQEVDKVKAELITANQTAVDNAIMAVRSLLANQMSWPAIKELVKQAQANGDPTANIIKQLKFETNQISLLLTDPYSVYEEDDDEDEEEETKSLLVDVDLAQSAWSNARKYYDLKRTAAQKEQKTIDASQKALKSAERKTQQTLKDVRTVSAISKARKVYWFEKFYWFISSENYLVIGGRDAQQNELIVKRYMRPTDIYVHAEIQGASSVVIRNHNTAPIPPKTLVEAGTMAISYSVAWDAKVITNAYWVHSNQVSKTAPSGEYLGTGSFMIRGKKNFLPTCHLIMGLSLLFKIDEENVEKHRGERKVRTIEEQFAQDGRYEQESVQDKEVDLQSDSEDEKSNAQDTDTKDNAFPDTEIKVDHGTGLVQVKAGVDTVQKKLANVNLKNEQLVNKLNAIDDEEAIIIAAAPSRKKLQQNSKKRKDEKSRQKQERQQQQQAHMNEQKDNTQPKRGQKSKLKKIKAKYKDQDEEERQLRMNILRSAAGIEKEENAVETEVKEKETNVKKVTFQESEERKQKKQQQTEAAADVDESEEIPIGADLELLETLTGQPYEDDELLFAIPTVAPYQALQNYK